MSPIASTRRVVQRLGIVLVVILGMALTSSASAITLTGTLTTVVDGDTIKVRSRGFETTVRLVGIDTPETHHPTRPVECFGPAASRRLARLLPVGEVLRLVTDPTQEVRDRYGRLLAYVYRDGRRGVASVNRSLVATGHARAYLYRRQAFRFAPAFLAAEASARRARRGLWGPPCNGDTTKPDPSQARPPTLTPPPAPPTAPGPPSSPGPCDPAYPGVCIAPAPPDLDCGQIRPRNFRVLPSDPHHFDVDGDGIGCEE